MVGHPIPMFAHVHLFQSPVHALQYLGSGQSHMQWAKGYVVTHGGTEELVVWVLEDEAYHAANDAQIAPGDLVPGDPYQSLTAQDAVEM